MHPYLLHKELLAAQFQDDKYHTFWDIGHQSRKKSVSLLFFVALKQNKPTCKITSFFISLTFFFSNCFRKTYFVMYPQFRPVIKKPRKGHGIWGWNHLMLLGLSVIHIIGMHRSDTPYQYRRRYWQKIRYRVSAIARANFRSDSCSYLRRCKLAAMRVFCSVCGSSRAPREIR